MEKEYIPYINPARTEARQNAKDTFSEHGVTIGEPWQATMGYWGRDAEWCVYLKKYRKGEVE
jgi:hypothetical protein